MNSLPDFTGADKRNSNRIVEELRKYFVPQRNILYERFLFNSRATVGVVVKSLTSQPADCSFECGWLPSLVAFPRCSAARLGNKGMVVCQTVFGETHFKDPLSCFAGKSRVIPATGFCLGSI